MGVTDSVVGWEEEGRPLCRLGTPDLEPIRRRTKITGFLAKWNAWNLVIYQGPINHYVKWKYKCKEKKRGKKTQAGLK